MPERIQLRRTKGWRKPENTVVVARPSKWGNPVRWWPQRTVTFDPAGEMVVLPVDYGEARRISVAGFKEVLSDPELRATYSYPTDDQIRAELAGHDLACWCPLDQPCHADVLLELANGPQP